MMVREAVGWGVQLGQDALHEQRGVDIVTGLQSKVCPLPGLPSSSPFSLHLPSTIHDGLTRRLEAA